jgi:energy-coupling factor transporter transmembrane protein EcfT
MVALIIIAIFIIISIVFAIIIKKTKNKIIKTVLQIIALIVMLTIIIAFIVGIIQSCNNDKKWEEQMQQARIQSETNRHNREAEIQRNANIALNPLKVKCINFVCSRLSTTELLKILIKYETQNVFDIVERDFRNNNLRFDISNILNWNFNLNFSDTIAGYIVEEDIFFRMPNEDRDRRVTISSEEMIRWIVENIYARKRDIENIPANQRNRSFLFYEVNNKGEIEHKIINK